MAIYIISNDNYLQEGIVLLAKEANPKSWKKPCLIYLLKDSHSTIPWFCILICSTNVVLKKSPDSTKNVSCWLYWTQSGVHWSGCRCDCQRTAVSAIADDDHYASGRYGKTPLSGIMFSIVLKKGLFVNRCWVKILTWLPNHWRYRRNGYTPIATLRVRN